MAANLTVREYTPADVGDMAEIWNEVVREGVAFPQEDYLTPRKRRRFLYPAGLLRRCRGWKWKNIWSLQSAPK